MLGSSARTAPLILCMFFFCCFLKLCTQEFALLAPTSPISLRACISSLCSQRPIWQMSSVRFIYRKAKAASDIITTSPALALVSLSILLVPIWLGWSLHMRCQGGGEGRRRQQQLQQQECTSSSYNSRSAQAANISVAQGSPSAF
jgi:hypothetical protein